MSRLVATAAGEIEIRDLEQCDAAVITSGRKTAEYGPDTLELLRRIECALESQPECTATRRASNATLDTDS